MTLKETRQIERNWKAGVRSLDPGLIVFNGHGSSDKIGGHENEILVEKGKNSELIKNRIIFSRVCNSASELGSIFTNSGEAFI